MFAEWAVNFRHEIRGRTGISNVDLSVTIVLFTTALSIFLNRNISDGMVSKKIHLLKFRDVDSIQQAMNI